MDLNFQEKKNDLIFQYLVAKILSKTQSYSLWDTLYSLFVCSYFGFEALRAITIVGHVCLAPKGVDMEEVTSMQALIADIF